MQTINAFTLNRAAKALGAHFITKAHRVAKDIGFSYWPKAQAPETYEALCEAFQVAQKTRTALPIWEGGSDATIYGSAEANYAFRYLHDLGHVVHALPFTFEAEVELSRLQGADIAQHFGPESLELLVYRIDTEGQSIYAHFACGEFPEDQAAFVYVVARLMAQHGYSLSDAVRLFIEGPTQAA